MTDNVAIRPLTRTMPLGLQVTVLAALSAGGTLATNILLPSLPGIAMAVGVSSAQVTSAITVFLAMFAVGQLIVGPASTSVTCRVGSIAYTKLCLPPWGPHVRFRRVQTLVREGSPSVKLRNSA